MPLPALRLSVLASAVATVGIVTLAAPSAQSVEPFEAQATISVSHTSKVVVSGGYAFVASNSTITAIDTSTNTIARTVPTGGIISPQGAAAAGDRVFFAAAGSNELVTLDTRTWTVSLLSTNPGGVCVRPVNLFLVSPTRLVVDCETSDAIQIYDITGSPTLLHTVATGGSPRLMSADGNTIFVPNISANNVSIIDTSAATPTARNVNVGSRPNATAFFGEKIYVANYGSNSVTVLDRSFPNGVRATLPVGVEPQEIKPCSGNIFTANRVSGTTSVISSSTDLVTNTVTLDSTPATSHVMGVSGAYAYFLNYDRGTVSVVDCSAQVRVALVGIAAQPSSIAFSDSSAYIAAGNNTVSVVSIPVTQASGTSGSASSVPTETLTLQDTPGVSCASSSAAGSKGQWVTLPASGDCQVAGEPNSRVLGWATIDDFPVDIAQRQVANGWGAYELFDTEGRMTGVFIPAGGATLLTGSTPLYPVVG